MNSSKPDYSRCKPLLGTFVQVSLFGNCDETAFHAFSEAAYSEILKAEQILSFHRSDSDLGKLNQTQPGQWITVHPWLASILRRAEELYFKSEGIFDVGCGSALLDWGRLPDPSGAKSISCAPLSGIKFEIRGAKVRRLTSAILDLGGIGKGFVVDLAAEKLLELHPSISGTVNAGGDLRVFGKRIQPVSIQIGSGSNSHFLKSFWENTSLATSSVRFSTHSIGKKVRRVSEYVQMPHRQPFLRQLTVTVNAPDTITADSLTKIVMMAPHNIAVACLKHWNAQAQWIETVNSDPEIVHEHRLLP